MNIFWELVRHNNVRKITYTLKKLEIVCKCKLITPPPPKKKIKKSKKRK